MVEFGFFLKLDSRGLVLPFESNVTIFKKKLDLSFTYPRSALRDITVVCTRDSTRDSSLFETHFGDRLITKLKR